MASVLRQAEHALGEDVAEALGGAGADAARAGEELVELPLALAGRPGRTVGDLGVRADHRGRALGEVLVPLAPEELRRRALGPGRAAAQDLRQGPVTVERERLLADPEAGDLLAHDRVGALFVLPDEPDEPVEGVAQRDRKGTRLNSTHTCMSYAGFCLASNHLSDTLLC